MYGLVEEGQAWSEDHAKAKDKYATIWKQCLEAQARREQPPLRFTWAPAHRSLEQVLEQGLRVDHWIGNQWADFFAKAGAQQHRVEARRVEHFTDYVARMLARARFMAWALSRISASGRWDDRDSDGAKIKMVKSVSDIKQHAVVFGQHAYAHLPK